MQGKQTNTTAEYIRL